MVWVLLSRFLVKINYSGFYLEDIMQYIVLSKKVGEMVCDGLYEKVFCNY